MASRSRTEYAAKNTTVAVISQVAAILMGYLVRIVFTHTLSADYVGVNGLFLDIINILSLTELGLGTAITYALYRPIQDNDIEKQKSLMRLFRDFYRIVAALVLGLGLLILPFMDLLFKETPAVDHLIVIYLLYLINNAGSYLLIYKKTLIDAHQLSYIGTVYKTTSWMLQDIAQIMVLVFTHNFILYLCMNLAATLGSNLLISRRADRMYPYLKDGDPLPLPKEERQEIFKNISAMMMHKLSTVVVNNTDNVILSACIGVVTVGKYSNYYLIIHSVKNVLLQLFEGIAASIGNLGVSSESTQVKKVFETTFFLCQWAFGLGAIALFEMLDPFVALSFGESYVFEKNVVFMLCVCFFVSGMRNATLVFRDSLGLFWYDRYKAIAEAVLNIAISLLLVQKYGAAGVFAGTVLSTLFTSTWVEPYVLYKHRLREPVRGYFARYLLYTAVMALTAFGTDRLCGLLATQSLLIVQLAVRFVICLIVPNVVLLLVYWNTEEFRFACQKARLVIERRKDRKGRSGCE